MSDTKLLQGIASRIALMDQKIDNLDKKIDGVEERLANKIDKVDKRVTTLGLDIARLEDDAPTIKSHNNLKKRVKVLENKILI